MKKFMDENFLLQTETAVKLFQLCKDEPIVDWHCHLSPKEIYENKQPEDIAQLWLGGDHYKWRAMRSYGISEEYITGNKSGYEKFKAWAKVMPSLIGNPLYHWTHLELQRFFDIYTPLSEATADEIWEKANAKIAAGGFRPRDLITRSNVKSVFTTDDPADSLEYHKLLKEDKSFSCLVLPAFRPDKALNIDLPTFVPWLKDLEKAADMKIDSFEELKAALLKRIEFFAEMGCKATDHALGGVPFALSTPDELEAIFKKGKNGETLTQEEADKYKTALLRFLAKEYYKKGWAMEIHIGALRNNNTRMFEKLGPDTGFDSIDDRQIAYPLSRLLDSIDKEGMLPKTILFTLNPKDNYVLGTMIGNFQSDEIGSKMQFGTAWWFNDNIDGMEAQIKALANLGCLGKFIGMLTDSRSFLSYPRHEYFRRILCNFMGGLVENGEYPFDLPALERMVKDISYYNAVKYFGLEL